MLTKLQQLKTNAALDRFARNDAFFAKAKNPKFQGKKLQGAINKARQANGSDKLYSTQFQKMYGVKPKLK